MLHIDTKFHKRMKFKNKIYNYNNTIGRRRCLTQIWDEIKVWEVKWKDDKHTKLICCKNNHFHNEKTVVW